MWCFMVRDKKYIYSVKVKDVRVNEQNGEHTLLV